jgi:8-oxo-dGTP pyrophosphatase MutT (NUDIX family)
MSFLDRIRALNTHDLSGYRVFRIAGKKVGFVKHAFAAILARWPDVFRIEQAAVNLVPALDNPEKRSAAVNEVLLQLRREGVIEGWRNELYPVNRFYGEPPYLLMERAAIPFFGVRAYGVHMNGFVRTGNEVRMWLGHRSPSKPNEPSKLDQLVAGGQPAGIGLKANLIKECWEEAGIPVSLAKRAVSVGAVSYCWETSQGLRPDVIFAFDLALPADFTPINRDGEVQDFFLWPIEKVSETVHASNHFKSNCALVVIDFLIRHGFIPPEHPDYLKILRGLLS